jgi:ribosomal RNA assembly protein
MNRTNYVRIPNSRIGVVIGPKGSVKAILEEKSQSKIEVDSETGEVAISPIDEHDDPILSIKIGEVIKAIGRGFTPEQAMKLFDPSNYLEIISLKQYIGSSNKALHRVRSRVIGSEGKTRKTIEQFTKTSVVIAGSTISIIGKYTNLIDAKEAIIRIVTGENQTSVYSWLEERKKELLKAEADPTWDEPDLDNMTPDEIHAMLKQDKEAEDIDLTEEFDKIIEDEEN